MLDVMDGTVGGSTDSLALRQLDLDQTNHSLKRGSIPIGYPSPRPGRLLSRITRVPELHPEQLDFQSSFVPKSQFRLGNRGQLIHTKMLSPPGVEPM